MTIGAKHSGACSADRNVQEKGKDTSPHCTTQFPPLYQGFQCAVATFLAFAICLTVWSVRVRTYQTVTDPEEVARDLLDEHVELMSDEEFFTKDC
jgi:hypothetical protein